MNIVLLSKFIKSTHFLTIFMVFMFTIYFSLVEFSAPAFSYTSFKMGLCLILVVSIFSLSSLFRKGFIHSKTISHIVIVLSSLFYINEYLQVIPTIATQIFYTLFMALWSLYLAMEVLFFKMDKYKIEDHSVFPEYDCVAIHPFVEAYDFGQNPREPLEYEFDRFTIFYKNCYASNGIIYCDGEECNFFEVISYVKEQQREMNELSKDDFKLITMLYI
jgi:hypothetical protein